VRYPDVKIAQNDTVICYGDVITLDVTGDILDSYSYEWEKDDEVIGSEQSIEVSEAGLYEVKVFGNEGCSLPLQVEVEVDMFSETATIGEDRPFCLGDELEVEVENSNDYIYEWSTGDTTSTITIEEPGEYYVTVTNPIGCVATDTVELSKQGYTPETEFETSPVCFGEATAFTDQSEVEESNVVEWQWSFGDNGTSETENPSHTFSQGGIFDVTLQTTSEEGCIDSITKPVQVYHLPEPDYEPINACHAKDIPFTDLSTSVDGEVSQWHWSFINPEGDTLKTSEEQEAWYKFDESGDWNVDLAVSTTKGCSDTLSRRVNVRTSPLPDFDYSTACPGEEVQFTDKTEAPAWAEVDNWHWDFGDGTTSSSANPSHLFPSDGEHEVTLTVHAINGCVLSITKPVMVHSFPEVDFSAPDMCAGEAYRFTDETNVPYSEPAHWEWDFDGLGSSEEQNPWFSFDEPGQYDITLTVTSEEGCIAHNTKVVNVLSAPSSEFSYNPRFGASPLTVQFINESEGATSYIWDFGDDSEQTSQLHPEHTYEEDGEYHTALIATDDIGCSDTTAHTINVVPVSIEIQPENITYNIVEQYLETSFGFTNLSSIPLDTLYMRARTDKEGPMRETWTGNLKPGESEQYTFSSQLPFMNPEEHTYLCVEITLPERITGEEYKSENCISFSDEFKVLNPYPNPAQNEVKLGFVLPYKDDVVIEVFDTFGNRVMEQNITGESTNEGINFISFDLSTLSQGLYTYRIHYRDHVKTGRFMKW